MYIITMKNSLLLTASVVFITSCGGGGGGGGSEPSAPAPQNITVSLTSSADSAEVNSSITLTWSSTLATSCSASGSWSGSKSTSGSESITIGVGGSNSFSLSCSATGANSGSASTSVNGLRYFDGKVFDGYIRGAEVFVDTNDNLTLDANEASVTTDNQGGFTNLLFGNGTLVSKGGFDLDTGAELSDLTLVHKLEGYEASKLASPFTTLIAYMSTPTNINAALGIDASINLLTTDPIPNLGDGIYDQMYEKGNQLTVLAFTLQNHAGAVNGNSQLYFQAIADQLVESYAVAEGTVNIEDPTFISNVIDKVETARDVTFSSDVKTNLNTVLSSVIPIIAVNSDANTTTAVQRFAFSTLQNDVKDSTVMIGNASPTLLKYENNIYDYVASDQGIDESTINPPPVITSPATFDAPENQLFIGNIIASDPDNEPLTFSIKNVQGVIPGNFMSISTTGELNFIGGIPNYEGVKEWTATVIVSDDISSVEQNITVNITNVNEPPFFGFRRKESEGALSNNLYENEEYVGRIDETDCPLGCDQNEDDDVTYSIPNQKLVCGSRNIQNPFVTYEEEIDLLVLNNDLTITIDNGIDVESFNQVTFDGNDCWGKSVWLEFTIRGYDGFLETKVDRLLPVENLMDTPLIYETPSSISINEYVDGVNSRPFFYIDVFDQDGFGFYYSFSGEDADKITSNYYCQPINHILFPDKFDKCGAVGFRPPPDFETQSQYNFNVLIASQGDGRPPDIEKPLTVNIIDVDESIPNQIPVITSASTFSAAENQTAIGSVTATDADGDSLTYSISGSEITISSSGVLTFATAPDYETKTSYIATLTISDGTTSTIQNITVNVTNAIEAVAVDDISSGIEDDNIRVNVLTNDTFSALDVTLTVTDGSNMTVEVQNDAISVAEYGHPTVIYSPDANWFGTDSFTYTVSSGGESDRGTVTVTVTSVNDAPTISSSATYSAAENQTAIGSVTATDADGDSLTYSVSGSEINISSSGVLTFASAPDYETKNSYTAIVTVSDGNNSVNQNITVNVTDVDEAPTISSSATFSAAENQTAIGSISASDADGDSLTYSISGSEINISSSGVLTFATAPDYETKTSYTATVTASDGINTTTQAITVNVTNLNDNVPVFVSTPVSAAENQIAIGCVVVTDSDLMNPAPTPAPNCGIASGLTLSITGDNLQVNSVGYLSFISAPDYETKTSYTATVTASDGTNSTTQNITINVTDVYENTAPVITSCGGLAAYENQTAIGSCVATDADGDSLTYSISGSEINISSSGVLTFATAPDYETKTSYTATVTVSDGTASVTKNTTVTILDVNDNPHSIIGLPDILYGSENTTAIYLSECTSSCGRPLEVQDYVEDPDEYAGHYFTITGSDTIKVNRSSGALYFDFSPDYESQPTQYTATITAHEYDDLHTASQFITVNIIDVNEAPAISSPATFNAAENQTAIGTVIATDVDGDSLTYSISGSEINISSSGVLTFATAPDYETETSYTATVTVSDGAISKTQSILVRVQDINEAPEITSSSIFSMNENETDVGWVQAIDPEGMTFLSHTWSITGDSEVSIVQDMGVARWGKLTINPPPNFEAKSSYQATVTLSDGVLSTSQDITINIIDVDE